MGLFLFAPLLLQVAEGVKQVAQATSDVNKVLADANATTHLLWWGLLLFVVISLTLGLALHKNLLAQPVLVEAACKVRLEGYAKAELELKGKHATEIALNEANHQSITKGIQKSLDESNAERRDLTIKLNSMAADMAELFDTFAAKINTFAELQASSVARIETMRVEILLEISRQSSSKR